MKSAKKIVVLLTLVIAVLLIATPAFAYTTSYFWGGMDICMINGTTYYMGAPTYFENGVACAPVRFIAKAAEVPDSNILYDETTQSVGIIARYNFIQLTNGSNIMKVNGIDFPMRAPARLVNGRLCAPIREVATIMDCRVNYFDTFQTIEVIYPY